METVLQYEIPVLHPLAVHFPIALLVAAALFSIVWVATARPLWRRVSTALMVIGAVGALFAYFTGEAVEELSEDIPIVEDLVGLHENVALATLVASVVMAILACILEWKTRSSPLGGTEPVWIRIVFMVCFVVIAGLVLFTGHVGGIMVWGVAR